jgi:hypothetical protein
MGAIFTTLDRERPAGTCAQSTRRKEGCRVARRTTLLADREFCCARGRGGSRKTSSLVAEAAGKVWLFTLGPPGGASPGGTKVTELGPIPRVVAPLYLLRINEASGPPGSITPVHSHPGSEAYFVLKGEQSIRSPRGVMRVAVNHAETGQGADMPMQVSSSGSTDLDALVMFVVDATRPFSAPAALP